MKPQITQPGKIYRSNRIKHLASFPQANRLSRNDLQILPTPARITGRSSGEGVANKGTFDECSSGKRLAIEFGTVQTVSLQLATPRKRTAIALPAAARTRYDARGNVIVGETHTHTNQSSPSANDRGCRNNRVVTGPTMYVLTLDGRAVAGGRESEIEALYDLFAQEYGPDVEIVPCTA